ncbi:MAG TPA: DUF4079 family protein [Myxococcota bacterium]|nr:DUF4079 family protein [Myxococcota bacterium]
MDEATLRRILAFAHPAWMIGSLALAVFTARLGLEIRRRRRVGEPIGAALRARHLAFGRRTLGLVAAGFVLGAVSMVGLRERALLDSFHGVLGEIVAGLFAWTGWSGRALARGDQEARDIHRLAAAGAIAFSAVSAIAGFVLLP